MKKIELLAPAGGIESIYAAVQNGADAVYLGGSRFSARAYASNFSDEDMEKIVDYCHTYGVRIYVTVNTLIKQNEIKDVMEYIEFLYKIGVDALIVQDVGIAALIKRNFSDFEIHASTQMTIHNSEGALYYKELGFKRIVLSRELSLKEIKYISKELNIETEMFIHGALCVCYSGQCLMSSVIGGRSGNRGRCAQPCRLPYTIINENNLENKKGYLLSTKDMCTLKDVEAIINSGTASLKIEGRMKRPEYVAGVVSAYRKAIDSVYSSERYDIEEEEKKLLKLFNREGFSKAYLFGNVGKDMMAYNFPKNTGIRLGTVLKDGSVLLEEEVNLKDGIRAGEKGGVVSKIIKGGKEVLKAKKSEKVKLYPEFYRKGDIIYKTSDEEFLNKLSESYEEQYKRKIDIQLTVKFEVGKPIFLKANLDEKMYVECFGEKVESAQKKPTAKGKLEESLRKTGNTPFQVKYVKFESYEEGFLPVSHMNLVRRELLEKLQKFITEKFKREAEGKISFDIEENSSKYKLPRFMIGVCNKDQFNGAVKLGFKDILIDVFYKSSPKYIEAYGIGNNLNIYLKVPNIIRNEFDEVCKLIDKNINNIEGIVTANAGIIRKYGSKINIIGDYKLNIFNSWAASFYKNLMGVCISTELSRQEIKHICEKKSIETQLLVYGKIETMVSEYCPIGSTFGNKTSNKQCNGACSKGKYVLKDRKGVSFNVITDKYCRSHIYNPIPLNLLDKIDEIGKIGVDSFRIDFIDESEQEVKDVLEVIKKRESYIDMKNYTRGSYKRGVE
ncbi:DUF3656 domain-containing protein [Clostridium neuense]|uniref:DUF3656 domain-containing protein n=1 Tax=Clostridium neuense TaxID=1728934 RepID=A0ABW8THP6_9CLOT